MAMEEMAPPGNANNLPPPPQPLELPPGVYFNPGPEESVCNYLNRCIAREEMPDTKGIIFRDNVYGDCPDVLRQRHPPGNTRNFEHKWFFFSNCTFQSERGKRAKRGVATGGYWRVEPTKKVLRVGKVRVGFRHSFGFYLGKDEKSQKTPWLMEEYTSSMDDGTGKNAVPVFCKIYVSPRASDEEKRALFKEEGVPIGQDGKKKVVRVTVPTVYFDALAALLPPSSVRGIGQAQGAAEAPPPPAAPGHYQEQFLEAAPSSPFVLDHYHGQVAAAALQHDHSMPTNQFFTSLEETAPPDNRSMLVDEFLEEVQQLTYGDGQEFAALENHSMPMDEFFSILEEAPWQLTDGDSHGAQGAVVMAYPEVQVMGYPVPVCQELGSPQPDPKGDYEMEVDQACAAAAAGAQQEPQPTPSQQESPSAATPLPPPLYSVTEQVAPAAAKRGLPPEVAFDEHPVGEEPSDGDDLSQLWENKQWEDCTGGDFQLDLGFQLDLDALQWVGGEPLPDTSVFDHYYVPTPWTSLQSSSTEIRDVSATDDDGVGSFAV